LLILRHAFTVLPFFGNELKFLNSEVHTLRILIIVVWNVGLLPRLEVLEKPHVDALTSPDIVLEKYQIVPPQLLKGDLIDF
jgi:hypothetical protein